MKRLPSAVSAPTQVVVEDGRLYWPGRPGAVLETDRTSVIERWRNNLLLITVLLYLLFNWGFQQLRIPPVAGGGLPVSEIVLFLALLTINYTRVLGRLGQVVYLLPFMLWWGFGVGRALFDFSVHGAWALRDAAHVIESLFLITGFAFAGSDKYLERFFDWLPKFLVIGVLYGLLFPFQVDIWMMSPTIVAGNGMVVPIFGSMTNTAFLLIMAALYLLLFHGQRLSANLAAVLLIGYTVAMFQARTLYLVIIAIFGFVILYRRSSIGNIGLVVYVSALLLALIPLLGLQFQGRLGASFSFDFLVHHFLAIFGVSSTEYAGVASAAQGVGQRLGWWEEIIGRLLQSPFTLLLGLGYGEPLTSFSGVGGFIVREPHNSYLTILARTGVIGVISWVCMMLILYRAWHRAFLRARGQGWREGENRLMILMVFFISMWVLALGEDGFEKPYNIIPFYFFWGIALRMALMLARGEAAAGMAGVADDARAPGASARPRHAISSTMPS